MSPLRAKIGFEVILQDKLLKNTYPFCYLQKFYRNFDKFYRISINFIEISMKGYPLGAKSDIATEWRHILNFPIKWNFFP